MRWLNFVTAAGGERGKIFRLNLKVLTPHCSGFVSVSHILVKGLFLLLFFFGIGSVFSLLNTWVCFGFSVTLLLSGLDQIWASIVQFEFSI